MVVLVGQVQVATVAFRAEVAMAVVREAVVPGSLLLAGRSPARAEPMKSLAVH
jgi:hypothetical protein